MLITNQWYSVKPFIFQIKGADMVDWNKLAKSLLDRVNVLRLDDSGWKVIKETVCLPN